MANATIDKLLVDSQRRRHELAGRVEATRRKAKLLESSAIADKKRLHKELESASGERREILEAQYLAAVDRQNKAAKAYTMAGRTLAKLGQ